MRNYLPVAFVLLIFVFLTLWATGVIHTPEATTDAYQDNVDLIFASADVVRTDLNIGSGNCQLKMFEVVSEQDPNVRCIAITNRTVPRGNEWNCIAR